ncbi:hypothetical protein HK101_010488 [Irineochytrium annulatum]|nr:hypothetical protein HK101_010488 [Irineochytrium annulatum]
MGCTASIHEAASEVARQRALLAITTCERWQATLPAFLTALERVGAIAAVWAEQDERNQTLTASLKSQSLRLTELPIHARPLIAAMGSHLSTLGELAQLQRSVNDAQESVERARAELTELRRRSQIRRHRDAVAVGQRGRAPPRPPQLPHSGLFYGGRRRSRIGVVPGFGQREVTDSEGLVDKPPEIGEPEIDAVDQGAIVKAEAGMKEGQRVLQARWTRMEAAKQHRMPGSLVGLLAAQSDFWNAVSAVLASMAGQGRTEVVEADALLSAGRNANELSRTLLDPLPVDEDDSKEMDIGVRQRKLRFLRKWCAATDKVVDLWRDMRDLEIKHVKSCADWMKSRLVRDSYTLHASVKH